MGYVSTKGACIRAPADDQSLPLTIVFISTSSN
jgi:hypothetical protein